jgi:hypothetical protein
MSSVMFSAAFGFVNTNEKCEIVHSPQLFTLVCARLKVASTSVVGLSLRREIYEAESSCTSWP